MRESVRQQQNILLIQPPHNSRALIPTNFEPLALEVLAATVARHDVRIMDLRYESLQALDAVCKSFAPDIVGVTVSNTVDVRSAWRVLSHVKKARPQAKTVVGGVHATMAPADFYRPFVDVVFLGWAEKTFPKYVDSVEANEPRAALAGIVHLDRGAPSTEPMAGTSSLGIIEPGDIPLPNRELTRQYWRRYRDERFRRVALVNTARGCPYRCAFCVCWRAAGGRYCARRPEDICEELMQLPADVRYVFFGDDNTFHYTERAETLYRLILSAGIRKRYSVYCRSDTVVRHPELFEHWRTIGLDMVTVGFEGTSDRALTGYCKGITEEMNREAARILNGLGVSYTPYFLVDPQFGAEHFRRLARYVERRKIARPMFVVLTPLPGTPRYDQEKSRIDLGYDHYDFMHCIVPPEMGRRAFVREFARLYRRAYSFRSSIRLLIPRWLARLSGRNAEVPSVPLPELVFLWILAHVMRRKLLRSC